MNEGSQIVHSFDADQPPSVYNQHKSAEFRRTKGNTGKREGLPAAAATADHDGFSLISNDKLIELYSGLLRYQMTARHMRSAARSNGTKLKIASVRGQEAATVGVAIDLTAQDTIRSTASQEWSELLQAVFPEKALNLDRDGGRSGTQPRAADRKSSKPGNGLASGRRSELHMALGAGLANKTRKRGGVTVVFGHNEEGEDWDEALQIACAYELPIIFVCHESAKNGILKTGRGSNSKEQKASPDSPYLPRISVDGNDVVAIYRVASESIGRARKGRGPTVIECRPFHHGDLRSGRNGNAGRKLPSDALANMEKYLHNKGLFTRNLKAELIRNAGTPRVPERNALSNGASGGKRHLARG